MTSGMHLLAFIGVAALLAAAGVAAGSADEPAEPQGGDVLRRADAAFVSGDPRLGPTLVLSLVAVAITIAWFSVVANVVGALRRLFESPRVRRTVDAVTGTVLVGLGLRIATQARP